MSSAARKIFDDLLTLEINVIVTDSIPEGTDPKSPVALRAVVEAYNAFLRARAEQLEAEWAGEPAIAVRGPDPPGINRPPGWRTRSDGTLTVPLQTTPVDTVVGEETFDMLRERAVETECVLRHVITTGADVDDADVFVLRRIYRNCDQIKAILARDEVAAAVQAGAAELPLTADEVLTVRKVCEVGVASVVLQTVAQLDGDIITRIQRARLEVSDDTLHTAHREAVDRALEHWQLLFATVAQLAASTVRSFGIAIRGAFGRPGIRSTTTGELGRLRLRQLIGPCRTLRSELFDAGGKTIDTRETGGSRIVARTVIQPDGDVVCIVAQEGLATDEIARRAHATAVSAWGDELATTLRSATAHMATLTVGVAAAGAVAASWLLGSVLGVLVSVVSILVAPVSRWVEAAAAATARWRGRSETRADTIAAWARRAVVTALAISTLGFTIYTGQTATLALLVMAALAVGFLCQVCLRWGLRLGFKRTDRR